MRRPLTAIRAPRRGGPDAERRAEAAFWERAGSLTPFVAVELRDDVFLLPTAIEPKQLEKLLVGGGRADFVVLERACAILRRAGRLAGGETFVDVGAHIGTTTVPALTHQGFGRAIAIEPDPDHLPLLRANVALNALEKRVTVVAAVMAETSRQQHFVPASRTEGSRRWMKGRLVDTASPAAVAVESVGLDGLVAAGIADPRSTGLLWFDCNRCEEDALRSGTSFLEQRVPIVFTLRRRQFTEPTPLLARLRDTYEHVIDLRTPSLADPVSAWTPTFRPVGDVARLPEGRKLTDVLLL